MPAILREFSNVPFQLNPTADDHCRVQASRVRKGRRVEAERSELCQETKAWSWMSLSQAHHSAFSRLSNGEVWLDSKESIPKDSYSKDPVSSDSMSLCSPCQLC